ncbi:Hypothetical predicted protein [Cloeon dipterum]|uniref:Uncharacterized protein n=1 Tax=Cloeon dipterum TaxID=197152 RepID=A0A8S1DTA5_9INSE|nr:Hypothetical predicted protein [Cloeon dipterum]
MSLNVRLTEYISLSSYILTKIYDVGQSLFGTLSSLSTKGKQLPLKPQAPNDSKGFDQRCVLCSTVFNGRANIPPLTLQEAMLVPAMCPFHFNMRQRRIYSRLPQDPRRICSMCTAVLRIFQRSCYFTSYGRDNSSAKPVIMSLNVRLTQYISLNSYILTKIYDVGQSMFEAVTKTSCCLTKIQQLPPEPQESDDDVGFDQRCGFCSTVFYGKDNIPPLTLREAKLYQRWCYFTYC